MSTMLKAAVILTTLSEKAVGLPGAPAGFAEDFPWVWRVDDGVGAGVDNPAVLTQIPLPSG